MPLDPLNPVSNLLEELEPQTQDPIVRPRPPAEEEPTDLFKAAVSTIQTEQAAGVRELRRADVDGAGITSDRAAEVLRLSKRMGIPAAVVDRNYDDIVKRERMSSTPYDRTRREAPALAGFIARGAYEAAAVRDELEPLTALEQSLRLGKNVYGSLKAGVNTFSGGVWGLVQLGAEHGLLGRDQDAAAWVAEFARGSAEVAAGIAERARPKDASGIIEQGIYSGLESLTAVAPGLLLGGFGELAVLGAMGAQSTGLSYHEAREEGVGRGRALGYGVVQGLVEVATEKIPVSRMLKGIKGKEGFITTVARQAIPEITGENVATVLQDLNDWATLPSNAEKTFQDYLAERPSAAALTTVSTITMLGAQTAIAHAGQRMFDQLAGVATDSKLAKSNPEAFAELVDKMAEDAPTSNVYSQVDEWTEYWQSKGEDPAIKATELTGDPDAFRQAQETGGMIAVPVGRYAAYIAPTEHHTFFSKTARVQPDLPSVQEAADAEDQLAAAADQVQGAIERAAQGQETTQERTSPVREAVTAQLLADPGFHAMTQRQAVDAVEVARVYAAGVDAAVGTLATKFGEDPLDTLARYNLTIGEEGTAAAIKAIQAARGTTTEPAGPAAGDQTESPAQEPSAAQPAPAEGTETGQETPPGGEAPSVTTLAQGPGPQVPALAAAPARVQQGRLILSTRVPSAVNAPAQGNVLRTDAQIVLDSPGDLAARQAASIRTLRQVTKEEAAAGDAEVIEASVQRMMRNLRWLHDQYPKAYRDRAKLWYAGAHRIAQNLAAKYDIGLHQATAVLAVLSPQMDWFRNVSLAERAIEQFQYAERHNPVFTKELVDHYVARARVNIEDTARVIARRSGEAAGLKYRQDREKQLRTDRRTLTGRAWRDMAIDEQARLLRVLDETRSKPTYHVILPEGEKGDLVRTKKGVPGKVGWGTYAFIGDAIGVLRDGSVENIHQRVGREHKVRSFFNNISDPWEGESVTIDTHAVAAALLEPLAGSAPAVKQTMGGPGELFTGISGTNPIYAEAYFRLSRELGILPRELQSIVWEAVRGLFTVEQKKTRVPLPKIVADLWQQVRDGKLSEEELHARLLDTAGGIRRPAWADHPPRVAFDESVLRRGDVLPGDPGVPAGRGDRSADPERLARGAARLPDGPVVPRPDVLVGGRALDTVERTTTATRALDRFRDGGVRVYEGRSPRRAGKDGPLTVQVFEANGVFATEFAKAGFGVATVRELKSTAKGAKEFHRLISAAKAKIADGPQVYVYDEADYRKMRLFVTEDGNAGFALKPDPNDGLVDIVSVFNFNTGGPRVANSMLALAVQLGGNKLDCFDTTLPHVYAINGFRVVKRDPWNEEYKPEGWDKERFARFNNGEPDVVYMQYDPVALKTGPVTLFQSPIVNPTAGEWAYSRLTSAVQQAKQERASGRDWKNIIKGSKQGVNTDEFLLADVNDLDDSTQYSKQEVLDYLKAHQVGVTWHVMDEGEPGLKELNERVDQLRDTKVAELVSELEDRNPPEVPFIEPEYDEENEVWTVGREEYDTQEEAERVAQELMDELEEAHARELRELAESQINEASLEAEAEEQLKEEREGKTVQFGEYTLDGMFFAEPNTYREVFLQAPTIASVSYREGFAGLSDKENAEVARLRRQSTFWQSLFKKTTDGRIARLSEAVTELQELLDRNTLPEDIRRAKQRDLQLVQKLVDGGVTAVQLVSHEWADGHDQYSHIKNPIVRLRFNVRQVVEETPGTPLPPERLDEVNAAKREMEQLSKSAPLVGAQARRYAELRGILMKYDDDFAASQPGAKPTGPRVLFLEEVQAPGPEEFKRMPELFQKQWRELAFKWALRQAAEQGLDGIAWTTGQQQKDRYKLTRFFNSVEWSPRENDEKVVVLTKKREVREGQTFEGDYLSFRVTADGTVRSPNDEIDGQALERVVGPELAARIQNESTAELKGEELAIGGEGLARLYDKDFPAVVGKLPAVKKHGGKLAAARIAVQGGTSEQPAVLFTDPMRAAVMQGQALFQDDDTIKRGSITLGKGVANIRFTKDADLSTFLHETGHLYLHIIGDMATQLRAGDPSTWTAGQKGLVEDYDRILKYLGIASRDELGAEQHETFARAFEAYLMRGIAPSADIRGAFQRYRSWLVKLYRSMVALQVDLNDEIVQVFDRLVASDQAIEQARVEAAAAPLFSTAEQAGMTAIEWQGYQKVARAAHEQEKDALQQRIMKELLREREAWWKARRAEVEREVRNTVREQPVYRALAFLQRGELPDGTAADGAQKLSKDSIVEKLGKDRLKTLPQPWVYTVDGGLDVDDAASIFGFSSGDELLTALAGAPKIDAVVARETNQRMQTEFGNMRIDGTLRAAAQVAVAENGFEQLLKAELRAISRLAKAAKPVVTAAKAQVTAEEASARRATRQALGALQASVERIREIAEERIGKLAPKDINPNQYRVSARSEALAASKALADGRYEDAVKAKTRQRMAVAMFRAASRAVDEAEVIRKYAERLGKTPSQGMLGKAGHTYQDQVNALLNKYEFARVTTKTLDKRKSLTDWVLSMQEQGRAPDIPAEVLDAAQARNYKLVPIDELRQVRDALKQIVHLARTKNDLLSEADKRTFEANRDAAVDSIEANNNKRPEVLEFRRREQRKHKVARWFAAHTKIATLAQMLDGNVDGGPVWRLLVRPLNIAADAEVNRRQKDGDRYNAILKKHYPGRRLAELAKKRHIPAINASLSKEAILSIALNWGNETSRDRILSDPKRRWSRHQVEQILDTLDRNDWEFIQATWDFVDSYWQEISDKQFRVTGIRPEKVAATEIDTKYGRFRGGYYPLAYDKRLGKRAGETSKIQEAKLELAGAYMRQTTRRGHTKARLEHVELPVRLELGVLFEHIDQVVHDLTHHEALLDVTRMLRDKKLSEAIFDFAGDNAYDQFTSALQDIAVGKKPTTGHLLDGWARFAKTGAQISALGLSLWTGVQQPLGLFNGAARVGPKWVMRGGWRFFRDAATMENTMAWIRDVSPFMAGRHLTQNRDINELRNRLAEPGGWFDKLVRQASGDRATQQNITDAFLWHLGLFQRVADVPTWIGQYEKSMAAGKSEADAVLEADQAVRDSQGGGQLVDLSGVQRGGPVAQLFMVFYSYGATVYNQTARAASRVDAKSPTTYARFLGELSLIYFFPALFTVAMSRLLRGSGDDEDDLWDISGDVLAEMGASALNSMIVLRELGGLMRAGNRGYEGPAGTRVLQTFYRLGGQVLQGEVDEGLLKALNATGGVIFRYPASQAQRTVEGFVALQEGETNNPLALLFGPPRND